MTLMSSDEIRQAFLDFFAERGHQVVAASSLVPGNDPTLLFTNAGMVQFKDVFLGRDKRPYTRATTAQKCMRISGKHNDLENVGPSPRHHTFFEMLGNFSFGDYFKRDAIIFAYELLTKVYGIPPERLAYTVYETDDEAYNVWTKEVGVDPSRVARLGAKTNFWQMAETGPCGPTSEVHFDLDPARGMDSIINDLMTEDDRFLELWNLVFMQFNRMQPDPDHTGEYDVQLPAPGVDTGMGLERVVAVLQGVEANYDTDLFTDIMDATQEILGHSDDFREEHRIAYRVIADHTRAAAFLIADGVNPGTTGREYVPRMLIRRAWRSAHSMGVDRTFLSLVAEAVIYKMGDIYPELRQFEEAVRYQISTEERRFMRTLDSSLAVLDGMIDEMLNQGQLTMSGTDAFALYATHGLPFEITRDLLQERGLDIDEVGFRAEMGQHALISGSGTGGFIDVSIYQDVLAALKEDGKLDLEGVANNPYDYDHLAVTTTVLALICGGTRVDQVDHGNLVEVVLAETPFYVEAGGQVSDTGTISGNGWKVRVDNVRSPVGGLVIHVGEVLLGTVSEGENATVIVDMQRRWDIMRNHTATHLLHASLRSVLGEHVRQKGSLVAPDRLRFDFTHNAPLTQEELDRITVQVNEMILANQPVAAVFKAYDKAKHEGAMALFGEKYGETVRTITIPQPKREAQRYSYELCGGTHVRNTAEIGLFLITEEGSSSAGVRRIVAVTGREAQRLSQQHISILNSIAYRLRTEPHDVESRIDGLLEELEDAQKTIKHLQSEIAQDEMEYLLNQAQEINGVKVLAAQVHVPNADLLGEIADRYRDHIKSGVVVLGSEIEGKALLVTAVTPDLVERGLHAGRLIGQLAKAVRGGGGGGNPRFATGGGKDPSGFPEAFAKAVELVSQALQ